MADKKTNTKEMKTDKFHIKFESNFDQANDDYIKVSIKIDDALREALRSVTIKKKTDFDMTIGVDPNNGELLIEKIKRYRVKTIVYNSIYSDYKPYIFAEDLIEGGKVTYKCRDYEQRDNLVKGVKDSVKRLLETIDKAIFNESVTFNVDRSGS